MRKVALFTVAAILILIGFGTWAVSNTQPRTDIATGAGINGPQINVLQMMTQAGNLQVERIVDYSMVFAD
jgi:hypothetical protein